VQMNRCLSAAFPSLPKQVKPLSEITTPAFNNW